MIQPRALLLFVVFVIAVARTAPTAEAAPMKDTLLSLCRFDPPVRTVHAFDDIPQPIRQFFLNKVGGRRAIAIREDERFNFGDVRGPDAPDPEKRRGFSGAASHDRRWAVWYLLGGISPDIRVALFEVNAAGAILRTRNVSGKYGTSFETLCTGVKRFLAGEPDLPDTLSDNDYW